MEHEVVTHATSWQPLIQTVLLTLITTTGTVFGVWFKYKYDRMEGKIDTNTSVTQETHKSVNSTATRLAEEKTKQDQLVQDLLAQVAVLRDQIKEMKNDS